MNTNKIYLKLLEVQKEVEPIKKTEDNPFFKSKYFDVNAILAALKPILTKHGLVLTQGIESSNGNNLLETVVTDAESGEGLGSHVILPETSDPQKFGSAVTYYRRYALQSLFALEAEDDDANAASQDKRTESPAPQPVRQWNKPASPSSPLTPATSTAPKWQPKRKAVPLDVDPDTSFEPVIDLDHE